MRTSACVLLLLTALGWACTACDRRAVEAPHASSGETLEVRTFYARGLECPNCAANIERAIKALPGVVSVESAYDRADVRVTARAGHAPSLAEAQAALAKVEDAITLSDQPPPADDAKPQADRQGQPAPTPPAPGGPPASGPSPR